MYQFSEVSFGTFSYAVACKLYWSLQKHIATSFDNYLVEGLFVHETAFFYILTIDSSRQDIGGEIRSNIFNIVVDHVFL